MKCVPQLLVLPLVVSLGLVACGGDDSTTIAPADDGGTTNNPDGGGPGTDGGTRTDGGNVNNPDGGSTNNDGGSTNNDGGGNVDGGKVPGGVIKTVFVIMMENHSSTSVYGSSSADYINNTLMKMGAHATNYFTHVHPSEPNYIWLEAGDNLGITNDNDPNPQKNQNVLDTTDHVVTQLVNAGSSWKAYVENIDGKTCPLSSNGTFAVKHTPMLFFKDVTENFSTSSKNCIDHVRPFTELAKDLSGKGNPVARYNFITPNLCDDMHGDISCGAGNFDLVKAGDGWLKTNVPTILGSDAMKNGGLLLVVWDEGDEPLGGTASDGPLPFIAIGSMVKSNYTGNVGYTHSSVVKSMEEIFNVPLLRGAADPGTADLSDLFTQFP